jgi:5-methylthioadenosine/S-adenosylhomocysteine deaminase
MNTRFFNGRICTMENGSEDIISGELWVEGNRVSYVGPGKPSDIHFDREIDLMGNLVLPGFKNAHTHSAMTFLRSYADDMPLLDWLHKQVFPLEAKLNAEDVYWFSYLAILEYLSGGITANMDMYMFPHEHARASIDSGMRTVIVGALNSFGGSIEQAERDYDYFNNLHERISAQFGFHAEYTCSPELLSEIGSMINRRKAPVYTHCSESRREVDECIARTGLTPTQWIDSHGIFNYGGGAYHCVHMTQEDLQIFKQRNLAVISCPGSNTKLASGIAPLSEMLDMGIPVALGTDGPASNNCLDMFREMFLATGLQKLSHDNAAQLNAMTVLKMACSTGATVMGLPDCDSLAAGKLADLVVIDLHQPNMQPENNILKNIVFSGSKSNVKLTMINGEVLYEDGVFHTSEKPEYIYRKANEHARRIKETL